MLAPARRRGSSFVCRSGCRQEWVAAASWLAWYNNAEVCERLEGWVFKDTSIKADNVEA